MDSTKISPLDIRRGMRQSILAGIFGSTFGVCVALQFLTGFILALGGGQFEVALLTSLPMLGLALQFVSTLLTRHLRLRKPYWFWLATMHRLLWVPMAAIPFMAGLLGARSSVVLFLGFYMLSSLLGSMSVPFWFSWMADLVPKEQAGKFWGRRVALASLVNILAVPLGWFTDRYAHESVAPYGILFLLAAIFGQIDIIIHKQVVEPAATPAPSISLWRSLQDLIRQLNFRRLLIFHCCWNFASFFSDVFVLVFFLKVIGLSQSWIAVAVSLMWTIRWIMARYWAFLGDRFGHGVVLRLCALALALWPLGLVFWGHSNPKAALLGTHAYMGFFNVGYETAITALLLGVLPATNKSLFVSFMHGCVGVTAAMAPLAGAFVLNWTSLHASWFGPMDSYQIVFLLGCLFRLGTALFCSLSFPHMKNASTAMLVRRLTDANPFKVIHHSYVLHEGGGETERVDAVHELEDARSDIASEQLVHALRDPSREVRRGAIRALVGIGDRTCLPALIAVANSPETQIQSEAIEALGSFGDISVTPLLLAFLETPSLRLSALHAFSRLRDNAARERIRHWALATEGSLAVRATALEAWCHLDDESSIGPCLDFVHTCPSDLPRWQAALALGKVTVAPIDFYSVLQEELRLPGGTVAGEADLLKRTKNGRRKPSYHKTVDKLIANAQSAYLEGRWREATLGFTLTTLTTLEIISPASAERSMIESAALHALLPQLQKTLSGLAITRSRLLPSLHLLSSLIQLDHENKSGYLREEAILAHCLLRKILSHAAIAS